MEEKGGKNWQTLREGFQPSTWQMACHALTNWAIESLGNSVAEFKYLWLSCQGSSWSRYQAGMFDGGRCNKHEAQSTGSVVNMLQTWQSDLNLVKVIGRKRWEIKTRKKEAKKRQWLWLAIPRPSPAPFYDRLLAPFLHTASNQKLEPGKAWEHKCEVEHNWDVE